MSTFGFALSNFTSPGPRYLLHVTEIGGGGVKPSAPPAAPRPAAPPAAPRPRPAGAPPAAASGSPAGGAPARAPRPRPRSGILIFGPSSVAHTVSVSGAPAVAAYFSAIPIGGPVKIGPPCVNCSFGGVFLFAASSYGSTT